MLIDTHCHLEWESYQEDLDLILDRAKIAGVVNIVNIGTDEDSDTKIRILITKYNEIFRCVGYHPDCVLKDDFDEGEINRLMKVLEREVEYPKTVGVGECGLDYYAIERTEGLGSSRKEELKDLRRELFERQILLAIQYDLPLSLHVRDDREDAYVDVLDILSEYFGKDSDYSMRQFAFSLKNLKSEYDTASAKNAFDAQKPTTFESQKLDRVISGVLHCVSGSADYVDACVEMGFVVGFAGNVTYKNAHVIQEHAKRVPLESIVVETDGPFLSPVPYRGKRNESAYVVETAKLVAELRGVSFEKFSEQSTQTAQILFNLPQDSI